MSKYADIHCHPTLFPFSRKRGGGNELQTDIWQQEKPSSSQRISQIPRYSQCDLTSLAKGKVKLIFAALYPIEQNWFDTHRNKKITIRLGQIITHFSQHRIKQIMSCKYNYFDELLYEYYFLLKQIKESRAVEIGNKVEIFNAEIPTDTRSLKKIINKKNTIAIIPVIEGMGALINGNNAKLENITKKEIIESIQTIKKLDHPPFYVTFAHHFYNGLCGHSRSFYSQKKIHNIFIKLIDQNEHINEDFNDIGIEALKCLLSIDDYKDCGPRILVDAKHMSPKSRTTFYKIILEHNKKNPFDKIPIIHSHTAYSGFESLDTLSQMYKLDKEFYQNSYLFNPSTINLADDEVRIIHKTNGLIGIALEEKLISGKLTTDQAKKKFSEAITDEARFFWAKQIMRNILGMVNAVVENSDTINKYKVWDLFAIGSDFDGFIDPVDAFVTAEEFPQLEYFLIEVLKKHRNFDRISFGYTVEQIVEKIMFKNAYNFLLKHFPKVKQMKLITL
jgi:hypothetical protein